MNYVQVFLQLRFSSFEAFLDVARDDLGVSFDNRSPC